MSNAAISLLLLICLPALALQPIPVDILHFSSAKAGSYIPLVSLGMGTPPQIVTALLDTGSSDLIEPDKDSAICRDPQQQCTALAGFATGAFDRKKSSSSVDLQDAVLNAQYANGVSLRGSYIRETLTFGNTAVSNVQFGLASTGRLPSGDPLFPIFGIGPRQGEVARQLYDNIPAQMLKNNQIQTNAFSLYLNDFRGSNGSIIFGGIDKAKFSGSLKEVPIINANDGTMPSFVTKFSSVGFASGQGKSKRGLSAANYTAINLSSEALPAVLLDSGNPGLDIPFDSVLALARALNATYDQRAGFNLKCNAGGPDAKIVFGFNQDAVKIEVPLEMLMQPASNSNSGQPGSNMCKLPIEDGGQRLASLGAPFLQAAYVVFDASAQKMLLAQAVINATTSEIQSYP